MPTPSYTDRYIPPAGLDLSVEPEIGYPFNDRQIPDLTAKTYTREYLIDPRRFTPRIASDDTEPSDAAAYIVSEVEAKRSNSRVGRCTRIFANVPGDQIKYDKRSFGRPALDDITLATWFAVSFDSGVTSHLFAARKSVSSIAVLVAGTATETGSTSTSETGSQTGTVGRTGSIPRTGSVSITGTGGGSSGRPPFNGTESFDLTGSGGTQTIYVTDSAATILSKVSAATGGISVINFLVFVDAYQVAIQYTAGVSNPFNGLQASAGVTNLDFAGSTSRAVFVQAVGTGGGGGSGTETYGTTDTPNLTDAHSLSQSRSGTQTPSLTRTYAVPTSKRRFYIPGHGAIVGDYCALYNGPRIVARSIVAQVDDADYLWFPLGDVDGQDFVSNFAVFSSAANYRIVNGVRDCSVRITEKFYLPGVTPGITTGADVPQVTLYADPIGWFQAVLDFIAAAPDPNFYRAIVVSELSAWMGRILHEEITEIQMADAFETRDKNA